MNTAERGDAEKENLKVFSAEPDSASGLCCRAVGKKTKQLRRRRRERNPLQDITWMFANKQQEETGNDREEQSTSESSEQSSTGSKRKAEATESVCSGSADEGRRKNAKATLKKMR